MNEAFEAGGAIALDVGFDVDSAHLSLALVQPKEELPAEITELELLEANKLDGLVGGQVIDLTDEEPAGERASSYYPDRRHDNKALSAYLQAIGRRSLLTSEQEVDLAQRIERGAAAQRSLEPRHRALPKGKEEKVLAAVAEGVKAKQTFIEANLRLVVSIARKYRHSGLVILDLIQAGNIGLDHAVDKFDWRKGFKFSTYGTWWIRQSIQRYIADTGLTIRLPIHQHDRLRILHRLEVEKFSDEEILCQMGINRERLEFLRVLRRGAHLSLDSPLGENQEITLGDTLRDDSAERKYDLVEELVDRSGLASALGSVLTSREHEFVTMRFGLTGQERKTLDELGEHYGISREAARQIEKIALWKLKHPVAFKALSRIFAELVDMKEDAWKQNASCAAVSPEHFFPSQGDEPGNQKTAASICESCPVAERCLKLGVKLKAKRGVWGGLIATSGKSLPKPEE